MSMRSNEFKLCERHYSLTEIKLQEEKKQHPLTQDLNLEPKLSCVYQILFIKGNFYI